MLNYKKPAFWIIIVIILICVVVALCLLINPQGDPDPTTTATTSSTTQTTEPPVGSKYVYSTEGRIQYKGSSSLKTTYEYTYDEDGRLLKQLDYDKDGNLTNKHEYIYDENGTLIYEAAYINNAKYMECKYDHKGNMTSEIIFNPDGSILSSETQTYTYEYEYYPDGSPVHEFCYTDKIEGFYYHKSYDMRGYLFETCIRGDQYQSTTRYEYDKNGALIKTSTRMGYSPYSENTYDANGNLISEKIFDLGTTYELYEDVYQYDKHNNCTSVIRYHVDGRTEQLEKTDYTYDENGVIKAKKGYNEDGSVLFEATYSNPFAIQ